MLPIICANEGERCMIIKKKSMDDLKYENSGKVSEHLICLITSKIVKLMVQMH
jgi:hypothetical protein